jgi:hypothetical protein
MRVLLLPLARARALRRDDRAQVMILTGVMVFLVMIFGITTFNTGTLIYNRILVQNAVDAAADTHALWMARGYNLVQHLNDFHKDALDVMTPVFYVTCGIRMGCVALLAVPFVGGALYQACCTATQVTVSLLEAAQMAIATVILIVQPLLNYVMPIVGILAANSVAKANGADPILGSLMGILDGFLGNLGLGTNLQSEMAQIPLLSDFYVLPLTAKTAITLGLKKRGDDGGETSAPGGNWQTDSTVAALCEYGTCTSGATCMQSPFDLGDQECGWSDTYYYGYPHYNTWVAGKMRRDFLGGAYARNPWLNPRRDRDPQVEVDYKGFDDFAFFTNRTSSLSTEFRNPAMFAFASSQAAGDAVVESSGNNFRYAVPQLISVVLESQDGTDLTEDRFIWH